MRRLALLCCLWWGWAQAQEPVAPVTSLDSTMAEVRAQVAELADLMVGSRLTQPEQLHGLTQILGNLVMSLDAMAVHAEHGQITAEQRRRLEAEIERSRLMLDQLSANIRAFAVP